MFVSRVGFTQLKSSYCEWRIHLIEEIRNRMASSDLAESTRVQRRNLEVNSYR